MRIIVNGQQAFGKAVLEALLDKGEEVVAVFSAPDKPGRKPDPLKEFALARNLPVHQPPSFKTPEVREQKRDPHYVVQPSVEGGDVLIFTEALMHGTRAWSASHERRTLLYKYSPGYQSWSRTYYRLDDYPDATEQQRRLMAPPSIEKHPRVIDENEDRA